LCGTAVSAVQTQARRLCHTIKVGVGARLADGSCMGEFNEADRYLLEQIRQGSAQGWSQFVDRYQGRLLAFARAKLRPKADAEDLVQETLISFLRALPTFREESGLETYLFAILRRKVIDAYRGRKVSVCLLQDVLAEADGDESSGPAGRIAASDHTASWYVRRDEQHEQQKSRLAAALRELIDRYKQTPNFRDLKIVEMLFYCQLRNKDTAEIAGVNKQHVALVKHRVLARLRESVGSQSAGGEADPPDDLLSDIWQEHRLSCLKRSTLGAYVLGTLEPAWHDYVAFHLDHLGCAFCRANLDDLKAANAEDQRDLRNRIMESTVGFLSRS